MSLFLGSRNTKTKRASLGAAKHRGAAKCGGPHPHRYSSVDLDCRLIYRLNRFEKCRAAQKGWSWRFIHSFVSVLPKARKILMETTLLCYMICDSGIAGLEQDLRKNTKMLPSSQAQW
jgi:hypothetical protein